MVTEQVYIEQIRVGDTVLHNGEVLTVSGNNLKRSEFMGITLFGNSYNLGYKLVTRIITL
nr:hypothetical protein [uncultured Flavobacterium sp.]